MKSVVFIYLLLCVFTCCSAKGLAQSGTGLKQLRTKIADSSGSVHRISLLLHIGQRYFDRQIYDVRNLDTAIDYFSKATRLSHHLRQESLEGLSNALTGSVYFQKNDTLNGKIYFQRAIFFNRKSRNVRSEADTWANMGNQLTDDNSGLSRLKIQYYEHARSLYRQQKQILRAIEMEKKIAESHLMNGQPLLAEQELKSVLSELQAIRYRRLYFTYFLLSKTYSALGNLKLQLFYILSAVKNIEGTDEKWFDLAIYDRLAFTYYSLKMYDKSLSVYNQVMAISIRQNNNAFYYSSLNFITQIMISKNKPLQAINLLKNKIKNRPPGNGYDRFAINMNFGNCYQALNQYRPAEDYFLTALRNFDDTYPTRPIAISQHVNYYLKLSEFYVSFCQFRKADYYLRQLDTVPAGFIPPLMVSRIKLLKSKTDSSAGKYGSALRHFQQYHKTSDSLLNLEKQKQLTELQLSYETAKKDKDLQLKSANIKLLTQEKRADDIQNKIIRTLLLSGIVFLFLLLSFLYYRYHLKRTSNRQLIVSQAETSLKNDALARALQDNTWLIKEIHHRVKNNLQIIISLLNSQSIFLKDEAALEAITESRHRILAMSLIHQKLYKTDNVSSVFMPEYVAEMISYLKDSAPLKLNLSFETIVDPVYLDVSRAIPVGLILNETITNSIKHAFTHTPKGKISIQLLQLRDEQVQLIISDNGRGLPDSFHADLNNSFGMRLIRGLSSDLDGSFEIDGNNGTTITTVFDNHEIQKKDRLL